MPINVDFTKETDKRFTLRMDAELFNRVSESPKQNGRSVAKEIEQAVEEYLRYHEPSDTDTLSF